MHKELNDASRDEFQIYLRIRPWSTDSISSEDETVKKISERMVEVRSLYYSDPHPKIY